MGSGFGGTIDTTLEDYALRFVDQGLAVLSFDYRTFGYSDGKPRQFYSITKQLEDLKTSEMTPRIGLRIHLFSTVKEVLDMERAPLNRVGLSNLTRLEVRRFSYSDNRPAEYEFRFRNRLELKIAINHERINIDRTFYFMSDMENFIPLSGEAANRFSSKTRFRFGFGYRFSYTWRAEFLYLVDKGRDTLEEEFDVTAEAVNFRVKINF